MNFADIDMKKEFENYNKLAPVKTANINGCEFAYRYYKNPNPEVNVTLLVLAGGTGLADGMFAMAKSFMDKYSLIAFNYPMAFKDNEATSDAIYELIKYLKAENVYLWGHHNTLLCRVFCLCFYSAISVPDYTTCKQMLFNFNLQRSVLR